MSICTLHKNQMISTMANKNNALSGLKFFSFKISASTILLISLMSINERRCHLICKSLFYRCTTQIGLTVLRELRTSWIGNKNNAYSLVTRWHWKKTYRKSSLCNNLIHLTSFTTAKPDPTLPVTCVWQYKNLHPANMVNKAEISWLYCNTNHDSQWDTIQHRAITGNEIDTIQSNDLQ